MLAVGHPTVGSMLVRTCVGQGAERVPAVWSRNSCGRSWLARQHPKANKVDLSPHNDEVFDVDADADLVSSGARSPQFELLRTSADCSPTIDNAQDGVANELLSDEAPSPAGSFAALSTCLPAIDNVSPAPVASVSASALVSAPTAAAGPATDAERCMAQLRLQWEEMRRESNSLRAQCQLNTQGINDLRDLTHHLQALTMACHDSASSPTGADPVPPLPDSPILDAPSCSSSMCTTKMPDSRVSDSRVSDSPISRSLSVSSTHFSNSPTPARDVSAATAIGAAAESSSPNTHTSLSSAPSPAGRTSIVTGTEASTEASTATSTTTSTTTSTATSTTTSTSTSTETSMRVLSSPRATSSTSSKRERSDDVAIPHARKQPSHHDQELPTADLSLAELYDMLAAERARHAHYLAQMEDNAREIDRLTRVYKDLTARLQHMRHNGEFEA